MTKFNDSPQAALGFLVSQTAHIESEVYKIKYPDITYAELIPIDTSANQWARSVTYYSMDGAGKAGWINGRARDIPMVDTSRAKHETEVHMAGIGYQYDLEELNQARMLGQNLPSDRASYARRAYEEHAEEIAFEGDADKGFHGLFAYPGIDDTPAANNQAATSTLWVNKTPQEVMKDVNNLLTGVHTTTKTVEMADTLLLPTAQYLDIGTRQIAPESMMTVLDWITHKNVYTMKTGKALTVRGVRQLAKKGDAESDRAMAYRRSPEVLKMHVPMALQFLAPQQQIFNFVVPGMFRLGGLDIRLPGAVRYMDGL